MRSNYAPCVRVCITHCKDFCHWYCVGQFRQFLLSVIAIVSVSSVSSCFLSLLLCRSVPSVTAFCHCYCVGQFLLSRISVIGIVSVSSVSSCFPGFLSLVLCQSVPSVPAFQDFCHSASHVCFFKLHFLQVITVVFLTAHPLKKHKVAL